MSMTQAQLNERIRSETDACIEKRKSLGLNFLKPRRKFRPECELDARNRYAHEQNILNQQQSEKSVAINDAIIGNLQGSDNTRLYGIIGAVLLFMLIMVIIIA